jgi:hypothetical protein
MERFFKSPWREITHESAMFGTVTKCAEILRRYKEAWLTGLVHSYRVAR